MEIGQEAGGKRQEARDKKETYVTMFSLRRDPKAIEQEMIVELGIEPGSFWSEIDDVVVSCFEEKRR